MPSASSHAGLKFAKGPRPEKPPRPLRSRTVSKAVTHDALTRYARRWLLGTRRPPCITVIRHRGVRGEIADVIGWTMQGESVVIECKVSREDFKRDARKKARQGPGLGTYRYVLVPAGLAIGLPFLPGWGMLELRGRQGRVFQVLSSTCFSLHKVEAETRILVAALWRQAEFRDGSDGVEARLDTLDWRKTSRALSTPSGVASDQ